MEGVRKDRFCVCKQPHKLPRLNIIIPQIVDIADIHDLAVVLLCVILNIPHIAIGFIAEKIAKNIVCFRMYFRLLCIGKPLFLRQSKRGIQQNLCIPARQLFHNFRARILPNGKVRNGVDPAAIIGATLLRELGNSEAGCQRNALVFRRKL